MTAVEVVEIGTLGGASEIIEVANVSGPTGPPGPIGPPGGATGAAGGALAGTYPNPTLANVPTNTIKGRVAAGSGTPTDLSATVVTALLDTVTSTTKGLAPPSGGGTTNFLRADGTWVAPSGGGGGGAPSGPAGGSLNGTYPDPTIKANVITGTELAPLSVATGHIVTDAVTNVSLANMVQATIKGRIFGAGTGDPQDMTSGQATAILDTFTSAAKGLAPASGGGTTNYLRADGTWTAPAGGGAVASVDGNTGAVILTSNYEQLMAAQAINVNTDSPVAVTVGRKYTANLSGGSIVYNLPAAPAPNSRFAISVSAVAASNTATVNCGGSDRFQTPTTGASSKILNRIGQVLVIQYHSTSAIWLVEEDVSPVIAPGYATAPNIGTQGDVSIDVLVDVQNYNVAGSYTWNPPSWSTANSTIEVEVIGGGGGGGSGSRGALATIRAGGGGGGSANRALQKFRGSDIAGSVTVVVGAGGAGGVAATVDGNGNVGTTGGASSFGKYVVASGGGGGAGGVQGTDGGVGGVPGPRGMWLGTVGGKGCGVAAGAVGIASAPGDFTGGCTSGSGGGGGGHTAANTLLAPAAGGAAGGYTDVSTLGGIASTGGGVIGAAGVSAQYGMGSGGGGGFRGNNADGSAGGAGGGFGGGAGGGGGTTTGWNSGPGGTGGVGSIRVVTRP